VAAAHNLTASRKSAETMYKFRPHLMENTLRLHYKDQTAV